MNLQEHTTPSKLERYSFLWSEARLVIAAVALFIGGYPPFLRYNPIPGLYGLLMSLHTIAWIISGLAAGYLLYRWVSGNKTLFGKKDSMDTAAFFVSVISGINLGLTGLLGNNIGMSISSNKVVFIIVGLLYLAAAYHLYNRWKQSGEKIF